MLLLHSPGRILEHVEHGARTSALARAYMRSLCIDSCLHHLHETIFGGSFESIPLGGCVRLKGRRNGLIERIAIRSKCLQKSQTPRFDFKNGEREVALRHPF